MPISVPRLRQRHAHGEVVSRRYVTGTTSAIVAKFDANGNLGWRDRIGSLNTPNPMVHDILAAGNGFVAVTASFSGTVDFDPGPGQYNLKSANAAGFVEKLNTADGTFAWVDVYSGKNGYCFNSAIAADTSGNIYAGGADIFVAKLDSAGTFQWAVRAGGTTSADMARGLAVDSFGNVYVTGSFAGTVDFDPGSGVYDLTASSGTAFLWKLTQS